MAYAQRNGVLLEQPPSSKKRQQPWKQQPPRTVPPKARGPIAESAAWRGRLLDLQKRNKRPRLANPTQSTNEEISNLSDAQLMNISKGFFEKKPAPLPPNQVSNSRPAGHPPFLPAKHQTNQPFPYRQPVLGHGGSGFRSQQPYKLSNNPQQPSPFQLHPNQRGPVPQPPFLGPGQAPQGFIRSPLPPQGGGGRQPTAPLPPAVQQFAPTMPKIGHAVYMPGQPPPPPEPCPTPFSMGQQPPQQRQAQVPAAHYSASSLQPPPYPHPLPSTALSIRGPMPIGGPVGLTTGVGVSSSAAEVKDAAQDYFNSLPKPPAMQKKKRKRKVTSHPV